MALNRTTGPRDEMREQRRVITALFADTVGLTLVLGVIAAACGNSGSSDEGQTTTTVGEDAPTVDQPGVTDPTRVDRPAD